MPLWSDSLSNAWPMLFFELPKYFCSCYSLVIEYSCVVFSYFTIKLWSISFPLSGQIWKWIISHDIVKSLQRRFCNSSGNVGVVSKEVGYLEQLKLLNTYHYDNAGKAQCDDPVMYQCPFLFFTHVSQQAQHDPHYKEEVARCTGTQTYWVLGHFPLLCIESNFIYCSPISIYFIKLRLRNYRKL